MRRADLQSKLLHAINRHEISDTASLYANYLKYAKAIDLRNIAVSPTTRIKGQGETNIGHSLPVVGCDAKGKLTEDFREKYSSYRDFIGRNEFPLKEKLWTLESRDLSSDCPIGVSFHDVFFTSDHRNGSEWIPAVVENASRLGMDWIRRI